MNPEAKKRISGSLRNVLIECPVVPGGWPHIGSFYDGGAAIGVAISALQQQKRPFLTKRDAKALIYDSVTSELRSRGLNGAHEGKKLSEVFASNEIEQIAGAVVSFLESVPKRLLVETPFLQIRELGEQVELLPGFGIHTRTQPGIFPIQEVVGVSAVDGIPTTMFFRSVLAEAFDSSRMLLGIWLALGILSPGFVPALGASFTKRFDAKITEVDSGAEQTNSSSEIDRRAAFVSSLRSNKKALNAFIKSDVIDGSNIELLVLNTLGVNFESSGNKSDTAQIASASHWLFESDLADDESTKFVYACIGIEAIVGGGDASQSLGQRVADRASYLLGRSASARHEISKDLRKIFELRGKIVHGQVTKISPHDAEVADRARFLLGALIKVELGNLNPLLRRSLELA